ncbi:MAG: tRNA (uridine(54)-C5)-methyltransferase TrmA [Cellvibrionaceae bacterium]
MSSISAIDTLNYDKQFKQKITLFEKQLNKLTQTLSKPIPCEIEAFSSPKEHYRLRTEFKVWQQGSTAQYAMSDPETKKPVFIDTFPIASKAINELMPLLLEAINGNELLRKKCFQVEFLNTLSGDMLVTLIYHKALNEDWIAAIKPIKENLGIHIVGRSRKQKVILDQDFVDEILSVKGKDYYYKQIEGSFTQPNGKVCELMLTWAVENSENLGGDLLELYCGNGNFTLPLSKNFDKVLATEISKTSVNAALYNIKKNNIDNIEIARMSSEEFVQAMDKVREFRRLKSIELDDYQFSTVFVDPPRAGLDEKTVDMVKRFDHIIYISCNPETLVNNLQELCKTHEIKALAAFDQFPYTHHLETGVVLSKID